MVKQRAAAPKLVKTLNLNSALLIHIHGYASRSCFYSGLPCTDLMWEVSYTLSLDCWFYENIGLSTGRTHLPFALLPLPPGDLTDHGTTSETVMMGRTQRVKTRKSICSKTKAFAQKPKRHTSQASRRRLDRPPPPPPSTFDLGLLYILCIVEFLVIVQVFRLQKVVVNGAWLDGIDEIQNGQARADLWVLQREKRGLCQCGPSYLCFAPGPGVRATGSSSSGGNRCSRAWGVQRRCAPAVPVYFPNRLRFLQRSSLSQQGAGEVLTPRENRKARGEKSREAVTAGVSRGSDGWIRNHPKGETQDAGRKTLLHLGAPQG